MVCPFPVSYGVKLVEVKFNRSVRLLLRGRRDQLLEVTLTPKTLPTVKGVYHKGQIADDDDFHNTHIVPLP